MGILNGKHILLGVSSSVSIYKSCELISLLKKEGAEVRVILTQNATKLVSPLLFESLTGYRCATDTFERTQTFEVEHISWAKWADLVVLAPATANLLARCVRGFADEMLTTTVLATRAPIVAAPAMNTAMYENPATQENLNKLRRRGWTIVEPVSGNLACGDVGVGKLADPADILHTMGCVLEPHHSLLGKRILVTAGPTQEALDPVRYITNHSTGKMGFACARAALDRGAEVTLITGPVHLPTPHGATRIDVVSAQDMYEQVLRVFPEVDWVIKTAAVADYTPAEPAEEKLKKNTEGRDSLQLRRTPDILRTLGERKHPGQLLCGFAMETEHLLENAREKLEAKNLDLICCNSLRQEGAGFGTDTNILTLLDREEEKTELEQKSKYELAHDILDKMLQIELLAQNTEDFDSPLDEEED